MNRIQLLKAATVLMAATFCYFTGLQAQEKNKSQKKKVPSQIPAKAKVPEIVQTPFYDAVELLYCLKGFKVYPVAIKPAESAGEGAELFDRPEGGPSPGSAPMPVKGNAALHQLIECGTGKIVRQNVSGDSLDSLMKSLRFQDNEMILRNDIVRSILARNASLPDETTFEEVKTVYNDNVYLSDIFDTTKKFAKQSIRPFLDELPRVGGGLPKISTLAEGLAEFYIERVNEEINDAFFIHLREELEKYDELRILFPKTLESMQKIEVTRYNNSLNALKSAYTDDIKSILTNISGLTVLTKYQKLINRFTPLTVLFTAADVMDKINKNTSPAEILYQIDYADYIRGDSVASNNYNAVIKMACLFSYCGRDIKRSDEDKAKKGWLGIEKLKYLRENDEVFRLFTGLMAQRARGIIIISGPETLDFQKALFENQQKVLDGRVLAHNFFQSVEKIEGILGELKQLQKQQAKRSDIAVNFLSILQEMLGFSEKCLLVLPTDTTVIKFQKYINRIQNEFIPLAEQCTSVVSRIEEKDYSAALFEADTLASAIFTLIQTDLNNNIKSTSDEKQIKELQDQKDRTQKALDGFRHYGLFITSVAAAKSSEDVKNAIQAFALPKGSSRIKKENRFSWGLNGYVGVSHSWNENHVQYKLPRQETNIFAPLGFGANWGSILGNSSLSLYGGIIDIGAIFSYKVTNDSTAISSDIKFGQILSPSLSFIYGFPLIKKYNIPISFGASYQWGPKLKKVDTEGNSVLPLLSRRFHIFAGVDIPIVNFYVSRNKK